MRRIMVVSPDPDVFFQIRRAWVFRSATIDRVTRYDRVFEEIQTNQPDIIYFDMASGSPDEIIRGTNQREETRHVGFILVYPEDVSVSEHHHSCDQPPHVDFVQKLLRVETIRDISNHLLANVGWYLHSVRMFVVSGDHAFVHKIRSFWAGDEVEIEVSREHGLLLDDIEAFQPDLVILDKQSIRRLPIDHYDDLRSLDSTRHIPLLLVSHSDSRFVRRLVVREFDLVEDAHSIALGRNWDSLKRYTRSLIIANPNPFRTLR